MTLSMIATNIGDHLWWYLARSSGLIAFVVLTASTAFGLTLSTRLFGKSVAPAWLLELHRYLGALSIAATATHMAALFMDRTVNFSVADLLIPFSTSWRPGATAWGIGAFWCLMTVEITSLFMRKIPRSVWHTIHMTSIVLFASALVHGLQAGADARNRVVQAGAITATMTVLFLGLVRYLAPRRAHSKARAAAARAAASGPSESPSVSVSA